MLFHRFLAALALLAVAAGCYGSAPSSGINALAEIRSVHSSLIRSSPAQAAEKFRRMQKDLISFNRGCNPLFYRYVQAVGLPEHWTGPVSRKAVLHGDFHMENLGAYQARGGKVVVDLLDFDECFQGPAILDLYRCASSLYLGARTENIREKVVRAFLEAYVDNMELMAQQESSPDAVLDENSPFGLVRDLIAKAREADGERFFSSFLRCRVAGGKREFVRGDSYQKASDQMVQALMLSYLARSGITDPKAAGYFAVQDAVIDKGSGIGSAGVFKVRILVRGPTDDPADDVVLEFKEEESPAGAAFATKSYPDPARRVVEGEVTMQTIPRGHIGTAAAGGRYFFVSELVPCYQELDWDNLVGITQMREAATIAGILLSKGHARSTRDTGALAGELAGMLGKDRASFMRDVLRFCGQYEKFLRTAYERFSKELTFSPLLLILVPGGHRYA